MKRKKKSPRKRLRDELDKKWSKVTKLIYGSGCRWCGNKESLQSDHIVSRSNYKTRWRIENCIILCAGCHLFRKPSDPYGWAEIVRKEKGQDYIENLRNYANQKTGKTDLEEVKRYLTQIEENIKNGIGYVSEGITP